ncbi:MAG: geranylgeranylglycerol-phosphate geranylgeranyltransferase [Flavobacteriales bacterium]|nr:geranylgeranylglycerol-phosphate geranylgeranyltransferase [Flavobacteriales bacterium]MCB9448910.1 geranylgeranylglycerol-phosphate geranylgeranyltransferase [Flavobacteriales bacterium]
MVRSGFSPPDQRRPELVAVKNFLQFIRWPNLLIMALTMAMVRYCLLRPMLAVNDITLQQGELSFWLLVLSVVLIAAAGNMINDYHDVEADQVNKGNKTMVGKVYSEETVMNLYMAFNGLAFVIAFYIAWEVDMWNLMLVQVLAAGLLWFYSSAFKSMPVIGNLVVALLSALVPLLTGVYEYIHEARNLEVFWFNFDFVWGYTLFAFLLTWIREMIKDMEDYKGDLSAGYNTLPILAGIPFTKVFTTLVLGATMVAIGMLMRLQQEAGDAISATYFALLIELPLLILALITIQAKTPKSFHRASTLSKVIMLCGILYMLVIWHNLSYPI